MLSKCVACWVLFLFFWILGEKRGKNGGKSPCCRRPLVTYQNLDPLETPCDALILAVFKKDAPIQGRRKWRSDWLKVFSEGFGCDNICTIITRREKECLEFLKHWNIILSVWGFGGKCFVWAKNKAFRIGMSRICASRGKFLKALIKRLLTFEIQKQCKVGPCNLEQENIDNLS